MYAVRIALLVLHIASAALLFGGNLGVPRLLRQSFELGPAAVRMAAKEAKRRATLTGIASLATLWTGVGLLLLMGGFAVAPINYHIALTLMFVAIGLNLALIRPAVGKVVKLAEGESLTAEVLRQSTSRMSMGQGVLHLIWIANLILMFHRIYPKAG